MGASESTIDSSQSDCKGQHQKLGLSWGAGELQGWRPTMEDAFVATSFGVQGNWDNTSLFGVFDGHGGAQVAKFCAVRLPQILQQGDASRATTALRNSFLQLDEKLADLGESMSVSAPGHPDNVGCTAVVSLINKETIIVANAGDSRAVLSRNARAVPLSKDHKPNLPKEAARIRKAGGVVTQHKCGPDHVIHRVNGRLSLSRSIGDLNFKKNTDLSTADQLVSCIPDIKSFRRQSEDEFMVIACDGVWDVMTSQQMVDRVQKDLLAIRRGELSPDNVVRKILDECLASDPSANFGKGADNMTMILIVFDKGASNAPYEILTACLHPTAPCKPAIRIPTRLNALESSSLHNCKQGASINNALPDKSEEKESLAEAIPSSGRGFAIL